MINDLVGITNIEKILNRYPHQISGGQQQRVAIIRALGNNPSLLLMDEPMSHLDNELKEKIRDELITIFKMFNITVLVVTHDIQDALYMSNKTIVIRDGKLEQFDKLINIYKYPSSEYSALLTGKSNIIPKDFLPQSKHFFIDSLTNQKLLSVRPNQFFLSSKKSKNNFFVKLTVI